jgi:hypothetical protein
MINIDDRLLDKLSGDELAVFVHILKRINSNMTAFPSRHLLAKETGYGKTRIANAIKGLLKKNIISKEQIKENGKFSKNIYTIETSGCGVYVPAKGKTMADSDRDTDFGSTEKPMSEFEPLSINQPLSINKDNYKKDKEISKSSLKEKRKKEKDNIPPSVNQITEQFKAITKKYPLHTKLIQNFILKIKDRYHPKTIEHKLDWINTAILITEKDGIDIDRLFFILKWGLSDDFWKRQLNSIPALRKKGNNGIMKIYNLDESAPAEQKKITNFS